MRKIMKTESAVVNRIIYIDIAKGIGILLVIMGHLLEFPQSDFELCLKKAIYCFHMPLFFILSGMTYRPITRKSFKETLKISVSSKKYLMVSYVMYSLAYLIWDLSRFLAGRTNYETILLDGFKTIVLDGINVLWFISTLLLVEIVLDVIFWGLKQNIVRIGVGSAVLCICAIVLYNHLVPLASNRVMMILLHVFVRPMIGQIFLFAGYLIKKYEFIAVFHRVVKLSGIRIVLLLCCISITMFLGISNGLVDIHNVMLGENAMITIIVGLILSFFFIALCSEFETAKYLVRFLVFVGTNSLFVMATHNFFGIRTLGEQISSRIVRENVSGIFISFIVIVFIEVILIRLVGNRLNNRLKALAKAKNKIFMS